MAQAFPLLLMVPVVAERPSVVMESVMMAHVALNTGMHLVEEMANMQN